MEKPFGWPAGIPYINPNVSYVGVSTLRKLNQTALDALEYPMVIKRENGEELAVIVPWDTFLALQRQLG